MRKSLEKLEEVNDRRSDVSTDRSSKIDETHGTNLITADREMLGSAVSSKERDRRLSAEAIKNGKNFHFFRFREIER